MRHGFAGFVCVGLLVVAPVAVAADLRAQVEQYRLAHEADIVSTLDDLVRLPSIEADPAGLAATATRLGGWLTSRGFNVTPLSAGVGTPGSANRDAVA